MLAEAMANLGIRTLGDLPPDGKKYWASRFWDRKEAEQHPILGEHYLREKQDLIQLIEEHAAGATRVLEFCCGTGEFVELALRVTSAKEVVGVDISEHALAKAAERVQHDSLRLVQGDFWDDGLDLGTADLVLCVDSLQHLGNTAAVLARLHSFVAPGGLFIANVWTLDHFHELERLRYGRLRHVGRSIKFFGSAVLIRVSGGRLRSDHYRTKLAHSSEIESRLRETFAEVLQVTHHRYHSAFVCRA